MTEDELRQTYPGIEWDKPIKVDVLDPDAAGGYVCRFCIAQRGLRADEVEERQGNYEEIQTHIEETHQ